MSKGPHVRSGVTHSTPDVTMTPDGQLRDSNGLPVDEYVDESTRKPEAVRRDDIDPDPDEEAVP